MKKLYLCIILSTMLSALYGQYTVNYFSNGGNPGSLHNEDEFDGGVSWTSIYDCATISNGTNIYSTAQTIPFSFQFNSTPVTQFKVSNTGYITFDLAHPTAASALNVTTLPSSSIPNNSICLWGIYVDSQSSFAKIDSKVFGVTGSRQLWIAFRSFYNPNGTDAFDFTYWAVVLEEGTNKIYVVREWEIDFGGVWENFPVSVGVQINSSIAVEALGNMISIAKVNTSNYNTDNDYWAFTPTSLSVNENKEGSGFTLYPNPANEEVIISLEETEVNNSKIQIYNSIGELISEQPVVNNLIRLDTYSYSTGIYSVAIINEEKTIFKKLVISR